LIAASLGENLRAWLITIGWTVERANVATGSETVGAHIAAEAHQSRARAGLGADDGDHAES
jgi:hypothetical protein